MRYRFRIYDIFTIVGVIFLVAWVPPYMAEAPEERSIGSGTSFRLPLPRHGDTIRYEVLMGSANGTRSTGPVIDVEYRAPPEDGPPDAAVVEHRHYAAAQIDLGPARYVQSEREIQIFYNKQLQIVEIREDGREVNPLDTRYPPAFGQPGDAIHYEDRGASPRFYSERLLDTGPKATTHYDGVPIWEAIEDLYWTPDDPYLGENGEKGDDAAPAPMVAIARMPNLEEQQRAHFAAVHRDRVVYAKMVQEPGPRGSIGAPGVVEQELPGLGAARILHAPLRPFGGHFHLDAGTEVEGQVRTWEWYARDMPVPAGYHFDYRDTSGRSTFAVDLVPFAAKQGSTPFRLELDQETVPDRPKTLATTSLDEIQHDERPVVRGLSMTRIREIVVDSEAAEGQLGNDPKIMALGWVDVPDRLRLYVVLVERGWVGAYAIFINESGTSSSLIVLPACGVEDEFMRGKIRIACPSQETPWEVEPQDLVPPAVAAAKLRETAPDAVRTGTEYGLYVPRIWYDVDGVPGERRGSGTIEAHLAEHYSFDPLSRFYMASLAFEGKDARASMAMPLDGHDRTMVRIERVIPPSEEFGIFRQSAAGIQAEAPRIVYNLGAEPAFGGLALVLLGLLLRWIAAVKAGAHLPLFAALYAKISKDKVLQHGHREMIHALVVGDPGITLNEVAARAGLSRTAAFHHLDTLARNELVKIAMIARTRHYFAPEHADPKARMRTAVARHKEWDRVLRLVEAQPGLPLRSLTRQTQKGTHRISRIGSRLTELGLVTKEKTGRELRYYPTTSSPDPVPSDRAGP